jgi:hypothetical protein
MSKELTDAEVQSRVQGHIQRLQASEDRFLTRPTAAASVANPDPATISARTLELTHQATRLGNGSTTGTGANRAPATTSMCRSQLPAIRANAASTWPALVTNFTKRSSVTTRMPSPISCRMIVRARFTSWRTALGR